MKLLTLSIMHVGIGPIGLDDPLPVQGAFNYRYLNGWLFPVNKIDDKVVDSWLKVIKDHAIENGYDFILFLADAPVSKLFETF